VGYDAFAADRLIADTGGCGAVLLLGTG